MPVNNRRIDNLRHLIMSRLVRMRIRTKFLLVFFVMILLISTVMFAAVSYISEQIFTKYAIDLSGELIEQTTVNIHNRAKEIEDLTYLITQNTQIKEQLYQAKSEDEDYLKTIVRTRMRSLLGSGVYNSEYIDKIIIVTEDDDVYWWDRLDGSEELLTEMEAELYMTRILGYGLPEDNSALWIESPIFEDEIFLLRPIIDEEEIGHRLGTIMFAFKDSHLKSMGVGGEITNSSNIGILDIDNDEFFDTELVNRRLYLRLVEEGQYKTDKLNSMFITMDGEDYLLKESYIEAYGWKVISLIPQSQLNAGKESLQVFILMIALVATILTVVIAFIVSGSITQNIKLLEHSISKVEKGDFNVRIKPGSYDEIGMIGLRFNFMVNEIQRLIDKLYTTEVEKQKIEHMVLKAQINPHFLYNTLGSIKWMAESKGQEDISELVTALIELLKVSVKQNSTYVTLAEELNYITNYMAIIQSGLDGEVEVDYEIEDGTGDLYVLNFMLQPIVENAVFHGLELMKGNARIDITAYLEKDTLVVMVSDNGRGMDKMKLEQIQQCESNSKSGMNSIGVKNVHERLKFYYGEGYGLKYESEKGEGTNVIFTLPLMRSLEELQDETDDR